MLPPQEIAPEEISRELQRLLDAPEFLRNRNASSFLKFVVEEAVAGRGDRLKAFTIATLALQRDATFDPQNNSIVRVQATRVRQMLEAHYAGPGLDDPVRITLPRGSYVPTFDRAPQFGASAANAPARPRSSAIYLAFIAGAFLILVGAFCGVLLQRQWLSADRSPDRVSAITKPARIDPIVQVVLRAKVQEGPAIDGFLASLLESVRSRLSAFDFVSVTHDDGDGQGPDYQLTMSQLGRTPSGDNISFSLVHRESGAIVWTAHFADVDLQDPANALRAITQAVVAQLGGIYGAIFADWARRQDVFATQPAGAACIALAYRIPESASPVARAAVLDCINREYLARPNDRTVLNAHAQLLLRCYVGAWSDCAGVAVLQRALQFARRAYDLAPYRAHSQFALFEARFVDGRFQDAFSLGEQALISNPYSPLVRAGLGKAYVTRGDFARGLPLLREALAHDSALPARFAAHLALADYMTGDESSFERWAMRASMLGTPLGRIMRLLLLEKQGDTAAIHAAWTDFQSSRPDFVADPAGALTRHGFTPEIRTVLIEAMAAARTANAQAATDSQAIP